jgi:hypothetical protein
LQPVVMEEGQRTVNPPGDGQREPDHRTPHGCEIISSARHSFDAPDTLTKKMKRREAWQARQAGLQRVSFRKPW